MSKNEISWSDHINYSYNSLNDRRIIITFEYTH